MNDRINNLADAIHAVLLAARRPLDPEEVLNQLLESASYTFYSNDPRGIVRNCLYRHSVDNTHGCSSTRKLFNRINKSDTPLNCEIVHDATPDA